MRIRLTTDLVTGLFFIALAAFAILYGMRYPLGSMARMGPGYYPLLASSGLMLIGILLVTRSVLRDGDALDKIDPRPLFLVLAGTLAFGLLIDRIGLVVASVVLVVASRLAERDYRWIETGMLALVLTVFAAAVFLYGLGLPIKLVRF